MVILNSSPRNPWPGEDKIKLGNRVRAILFACNHNSIRSPIAEFLAKHFMRDRVYIDSVGLHKRPLDHFAFEVMSEIGCDLSVHRAKLFDELEDSSFDLIISLSPEAHHRAIELTRVMACLPVYWPTPDPSLVEGTRLQRLLAYREVRDLLHQRITRAFVDLAG